LITTATEMLKDNRLSVRGRQCDKRLSEVRGEGTAIDEEIRKICEGSDAQLMMRLHDRLELVVNREAAAADKEVAELCEIIEKATDAQVIERARDRIACVSLECLRAVRAAIHECTDEQ